MARFQFHTGDMDTHPNKPLITVCCVCIISYAVDVKTCFSTKSPLENIVQFLWNILCLLARLLYSWFSRDVIIIQFFCSEGSSTI